jgi:predicted dehydrogenase
MCTIQGDKGNIVIKTPVNQTRKYSLNSNDGESQEFSFDEETHRLYYEFVEFMNIIDNKDYDKANEMLEISSIASELMEEARKKGGIVFDSDK